MTTSSPIRIRKIDHVVIAASDFATMMGFYRDVLGCTLERSVPEFGLYQLRAGSALIDLLAVEEAAGSNAVALWKNMDHFCLALDTWDDSKIRAHLAHHGVEPAQTIERYGSDGTGPSIYITDPEGNRVELKGPPSS